MGSSYKFMEEGTAMDWQQGPGLGILMWSRHYHPFLFIRKLKPKGGQHLSHVVQWHSDLPLSC